MEATMLRDILSNIVIYDHLCRKIVKQATQLSDERNFKNEEHLKNILNDSKRAERLRTELIFQTNNLNVKLSNTCINCDKKTKQLRTVELTRGKNAPLCDSCYTSMVNGYIGNIFN